MKNIIFLFFLSLISVALHAQRFQFAPNAETYPSQLREFFKETKASKEDEVEPLMLEFTSVWTGGGISDKEATQIYKISNNFLKKRINEFGDWDRFLRTVIHIESSEEENLLLPWLTDLEQLSAKEPARTVADYLRTVYGTFYDYILFDDGRIKWKIASGSYVFGFDGEPVFTFDGVDIWGYYKTDSTRIEGTSGRFFPRRYLFEGNGGYAYFVRTGLSEDSASVELSNFDLNVTKTDFEADSVILHTLVFLKEPTLGFFEEKLTSAGGRGGGTFPRFTSYDNNITIKDIVPGADFQGGFSVIGDKFYGGGADSVKARFKFAYQEKEIIDARGDRFLLRSDKILSEDVSLVIRLDEDSIYHPKVTLRYLPNQGTLSIIRKKEGLGQTPFTDSYHNMDMAFEILNWQIDEPLMKLGNLNLGAESPVIFESQNYFRDNRFEQLRGLDDQSPLYRLRAMYNAYKRKTFTNDEVAHFMRMDTRSAHIFMMQMSVFGLVTYDLDTKTATLKQKVFDYINNHEKKRDYDVIQFVSSLSQGDNATISLEDYDMEINGISAIALSDSQKVRLFPANRKITVHKDLDFDFDGKIIAGRFSYWGELFKFNYELFRINMENVDSMRFKVESFTQNRLGQRELVDVKTVLQELTGELLIDDPNNKSSQKTFTEYPIFRSLKNSYIYYDKRDIFNGVYNREEFYVMLEPFEIDSLDNVTTQGLEFEGTFTSAGIFPDMQQTIKVQEDYSLGFTTETPPGGLAAYGGKGTFTNKLHLSNEGLRGDGQIDYLNSTATSDEFFFFPDSTNGIANNYEITAQTTGVEYPHALGQGVFLHWEPYNDVLYTTSKETPFAMYDDIGMKATGTLAHSPTALTGKGLLEFFDAETRSQDYLFQNRQFSSPELAFRVRANPAAEWGFEMKNARGDVNFDKEKGDFYLNDPADFFSFPANKYVCYMDYAEWLIPQKAINVEKTGLQASSEMVSIHPQQDSLRFVAENTKFFLENSLLEAFGVPNIDVADASIFPDTGYVAIEENAKMRTLNNAAITANRETRYHDFFGAVVDITSRHEYTAVGDYEYIDKDGTPWPIHFENIRVDQSETTVGRAVVKQEDGFYMSPYFAYYGNVGLKADQKALDFKGYTHIIADCKSVSTDWFAFESIVDPDSIVIDLPHVDPDDKTKNLNNGVFVDADTVTGYAAFLSRSVSAADQEMFFANGKLYFDEGIGSYVIVNAERLKDPEAKGNYLAFNTSNCKMHGEGSMSLGDGKSQMEINSYGEIDYNLETDDMTFDLVMGLDFYFSDEILEAMARVVNKVTLLPTPDMGRNAFKVAANQLLKPKDKTDFFEDIENYGAPEELPDEFENTILLTDVKFKWVPEAIAFHSEGEIGIGSFGKYPVNKKVRGNLQIKRNRRGDEIYLYLEVDRSTYFYFEYKRNQLIFYSSEEALMDIIKNLDLKKRRNEVKGRPPFTYTIGTKGKLNRFLTTIDKYE